MTRRRRRRLEPLGQHVRPAIVPVRRRAVPIRDRIPQRDHRRARPRHIHARQLIPVIHLLRPGQIRRRHLIAMHEIRGGPRPRMPRLLHRRLLQMEADRQIAQCRHRKRHRIGDILRPRRHDHLAAAREGHRAVRRRVDRRTRRRDRPRHMHRT